MNLTVEAIYENGVLKPAQPLPLKERETVQITVHAGPGQVPSSTGVIPCTDPQLIEWAAMDPELEYPPTVEDP